jgi:hypothetical protein
MALLSDYTGCHIYSAATTKNDPDTLTWDQAIADTKHQAVWLEAAKIELDALTKQCNYCYPPWHMGLPLQAYP